MDKLNKARNYARNFLLLCKTLVVAFLDGKITEQEMQEIKEAVQDLISNATTKKPGKPGNQKK